MFFKNNRLLILLLPVMLLLAISLATAPAAAKDYHFDYVGIDVFINPDGSFDFTETRTYDFSGEFSWATYKVLTEGADDITDFNIFEENQLYIQEAGGEPGTAQILEAGDSVSATWFFHADDERRRFTIKYRAVNGVKKYPDTAEFYWKIVGQNWDKPTDKVVAYIHLPKGASKDEIRAWGHGPLNGEVKIIDGETVKYEVDNLPGNTFVEARAAFPSELLPQSPFYSDTKRLPEIMAEEERLATVANRERIIARSANLAAVLLSLSILSGWFFIWLRYGREYKPDFSGQYFRELPGDYPPAVTGYLWRFGDVNMSDFSATIMDLARRGFLKINETKKTNQGLFGAKTQTDYDLILNPKASGETRFFERELLDFLFNERGDGETVSIGQIKSYATKFPKQFKDFIDKWKKAATAESEKFGFIEKTGRTMKFVSVGVGVGLIFLGIFLIGSAVFTGVFTLIVGGILNVLAFIMNRRTREGTNQYARWAAFRRYLLHFSNLEEAVPSSMAIWEHYLIYAVTLGVAKEVIRQLEIVLPGIGEEGYSGPVWYHGSSGMMGAGVFTGLDSLNSSFSDMAAAATSSMSSGSGGGGGFSSGGGGGGGGGGGSAG